MASVLPLAHAAHWLWVLYLPPLLIVLASLARSSLVQRRESRQQDLEARSRADVEGERG